MQDFIGYHPLAVLLKTSWQAAVLILLVLAAQWTLGRRLGPRWRCALWLLVVVRLALPWTIPSRVSLFNVCGFPGSIEPALTVSPTEGIADTPELAGAPHQGAAGETGGVGSVGSLLRLHSSFPWLLGLWSAGAFVLAIYLVATHYRLARRVTVRRPLIDEPVMNLLEDCKQEMGVRVPVTLVETGAVGSPTLFGFMRPRLLLPAGLTRSFSRAELRYVFLHELGHIKRHDILVGWLTTALQILHWFNPLVWLAFHRLRLDRELACDALALSYAREEESQPYGRTIIKLLESFGHSAWAPSLAGTVENRNQLKERISMIAKFNKTKQGLGLAVALFAGLGLITLTDAQTGDKGPAAGGGQAPPKIVATSPEAGAADVNPALTEITVTFDQDMGRGYSWTGGGPDYPTTPEGQKAHWRDARTCVLPVKLEAGHYYRVGINSTSYRNFSSAAGLPALPSAIQFTTQGASEDLKLKLQAPQIVSFDPPNGAQVVTPVATELRVTFNVPMGGGCSWCTLSDDGADFPKGQPGKSFYWTEDQRTCVLPVELKPGQTYRLGLNSPEHKNFQSAGGVPLEPVEYTFRTSGN